MAADPNPALLAILRDCRRHLALVTTAIPIGAVPGPGALAAMADTMRLIDEALGEPAPKRHHKDGSSCRDWSCRRAHVAAVPRE